MYQKYLKKLELLKKNHYFQIHCWRSRSTVNQTALFSVDGRQPFSSRPYWVLFYYIPESEKMVQYNIQCVALHEAYQYMVQV